MNSRADNRENHVITEPPEGHITNAVFQSNGEGHQTQPNVWTSHFNQPNNNF